MTGYGRGEAQADGHRVLVEIRAVNHRYLDLSMRLPPPLLKYEADMRRRITAQVRRGRLEVYVTHETELPEDAVKLNRTLAGAYVAAAAALEEAFGLPNDLTAAALLSQPGVLAAAETGAVDEQVAALIGKAMDGALSALTAAREAEGAALRADMLARLQALSELIDLIESREDAVVEEYRARLSERVQLLLGGALPQPERLAQEVALFADRSNVTEEVVRVRSHIEQFIRRSAGGEAVGKPLDFVTQELNREFNTIGSKSQDAAITSAVIEAKAEIEKIREQIQNVE